MLLSANEPKHTAKATREFLKVNNEIFFNGQVSQLISGYRACFLVIKYKTEGRETHKQAAAEDGCSKGLVEHLKGGNAALYYVQGFFVRF